MDNNFIQRKLSRFRPGRFYSFADGNHEANNMIAGNVNEFADLVDIKADHRTRIVTHRLRCQHDGLASDADGSHRFVSLKLLLAQVEKLHPVHENLSNFPRSIPPIPSWRFLPGFYVSGHDQQK